MRRATALGDREATYVAARVYVTGTDKGRTDPSTDRLEHSAAALGPMLPWSRTRADRQQASKLLACSGGKSECGEVEMNAQTAKTHLTETCF